MMIVQLYIQQAIYIIPCPFLSSSFFPQKWGENWDNSLHFTFSCLQYSTTATTFSLQTFLWLWSRCWWLTACYYYDDGNGMIDCFWIGSGFGCSFYFRYFISLDQPWCPIMPTPFTFDRFWLFSLWRTTETVKFLIVRESKFVGWETITRLIT